jgi:hypothetical protein
MANYFTAISEFIPGWPAEAEDMVALQQSIEQAFSQLVMDGFGKAFIFNTEEDAFALVPPTSYVDQECPYGALWKSLYQMYVYQRIDITKSSIRNLVLQFKNETNYRQYVTVKISNDITETTETPYLKVVTIAVDPGVGEYSIPVNLDHLPDLPINLWIERNVEAALSVLYDEDARYNNSMAESDSESIYNEIGADLWFRTEHAGGTTFEVNRGIASIMGERVLALDSHVTLNAGSRFGNRIDIVCLTPNGIYEVISSEVADVPRIPLEVIPENYLKIAAVFVPKNARSILDMVVNQDDTLGEYRKRSFDERIRRVERETKWIAKYNAPKRIKYDLVGDTFMEDGAESPGMMYDSNLGYTLNTSQTSKTVWDLKSDTGLDTGGTRAIDHTDHVNGIAKLDLRALSVDDLKIQSYPRDLEYYLQGRGTFPHTIIRGKKSHYVGAFLYNSYGGILNSASIGTFYYKNARGAQLALFRQTEEKVLTLVELSSFKTFPITTLPNKNHSISIDCDFSSTMWIEPGWYFILVVLHPSSGKNCEYTYKPLRKDPKLVLPRVPHGFHPYTDRVYDMLVEGIYPPRYQIHLSTRDFQSQNYGLYTILETENSPTANLNVVTNREGVIIEPGVIQSDVVETNFPIKSVYIDHNLILPSGASYKLEVSNNGGSSFYQVFGKDYVFSETGTRFIWRISLYPNGYNESPRLEYSDEKKYAIMASLATVSSNNEGTLTTIAFDGEGIIRDTLKSTTAEFSHWEWIRFWADAPVTEEEELLGNKTFRIDVENAEIEDEELGPLYKRIISDLRLEDLLHDSVDYSNYEEACEYNEYNQYLDLDKDIRSETEMVDALTTPFEPVADTVAATSELDESEDVLTNNSIQVNQFIIDGCGEELLAVKQEGGTPGIDLSEYGFLSMFGKVSADIFPGDLQLVLSKTEDGDDPEDVLGVYNFPRLKSEAGYTHILFKLRDASGLTGVKYFLLRAGRPREEALTFHLGKIEGIRTEDYPMYGNFLRARINMTRLEGENSPSINEIGVIPIIR